MYTSTKSLSKEPEQKTGTDGSQLYAFSSGQCGMSHGLLLYMTNEEHHNRKLPDVKVIKQNHPAIKLLHQQGYSKAAIKMLLRFLRLIQQSLCWLRERKSLQTKDRRF